MNWLDFVITYLACGTPFFIYRLALTECGPLETIVRSVRAELLWPLVGAKTVVCRLRIMSRSLARPNIDVIRSEMESNLISVIPDLPRFQFRSEFDRYVSLAMASNAALSPSAVEYSAAAGRKHDRTVEKCLERINRQRIERHLSCARTDLLHYIDVSRPSRHFCELMGDLAEELADATLASELSARQRVLDESRPVVSLPQILGPAS